MTGNDLVFVRDTMRMLEDAGVQAWLFGGWAEELLGLAPPRQHHNVDLLYPAADFALTDTFLAASPDLSEIAAKRFSHKRVFLRNGTMTELILVCPAPGPALVNDFWGQVRYRWPDSVLATEATGLRMASADAVRHYRASYDQIHATR